VDVDQAPAQDTGAAVQPAQGPDRTADVDAAITALVRLLARESIWCGWPTPTPRRRSMRDERRQSFARLLLIGQVAEGLGAWTRTCSCARRALAKANAPERMFRGVDYRWLRGLALDVISRSSPRAIWSVPCPSSRTPRSDRLRCPRAQVASERAPKGATLVSSHCSRRRRGSFGQVPWHP
jgi:hypothetical protein